MRPNENEEVPLRQLLTDLGFACRAAKPKEPLRQSTPMFDTPFLVKIPRIVHDPQRHKSHQEGIFSPSSLPLHGVSISLTEGR